jgi:hypothetical protein
MIEELSATADSDSRTFSEAAMAEDYTCVWIVRCERSSIGACSAGRSLYSSSISRILVYRLVFNLADIVPSNGVEIATMTVSTLHADKSWKVGGAINHSFTSTHFSIPEWKGTLARAVYCRKDAVFTPNFARITARHRPKPFTSGTIENKVKTGALRFCAHSNLRLLSFNNPEYHQLQACFNVETSSLLIFEPLAIVRLGVTGRWTVNNSRTSADIRVVPTNARANRVFVRSFSPG